MEYHSLLLEQGLFIILLQIAHLLNMELKWMLLFWIQQQELTTPLFVQNVWMRN